MILAFGCHDKADRAGAHEKAEPQVTNQPNISLAAEITGVNRLRLQRPSHRPAGHRRRSPCWAPSLARRSSVADRSGLGTTTGQSPGAVPEAEQEEKSTPSTSSPRSAPGRAPARRAQVNAGGRGARSHPSLPVASSRQRNRPEPPSAMGSFKGHVLPGTLFLLVGLWRVWSSTSRHAAAPSTFRVRAWNPVSSSAPGLRLLELYVIAGGAFADMCVEVLYSTHLKIFVDGGEVNPAHLNDLEHGGMLLMFALFGALALASQLWPRYFPLTDGILCLIAATAFTAEFVLFYFHSTTHMGLEGYYHYLLVVLVGLCIVATVLGALLPESFPVDLASGVLIALQGLWFYQTAFTLYGPMLPAGCARDVEGHIDCHARAAQERAEQLANFQFFGLVFLAFCYVLGCYGVAAARYGSPELAAMHEKHVAAMEGYGDAGAGDRQEECAI